MPQRHCYRRRRKILLADAPGQRRYCNDAHQQAEYRGRLRDADKLKRKRE